MSTDNIFTCINMFFILSVENIYFLKITLSWKQLFILFEIY